MPGKDEQCGAHDLLVDKVDKLEKKIDKFDEKLDKINDYIVGKRAVNGYTDISVQKKNEKDDKWLKVVMAVFAAVALVIAYVK